MIWTEEEIYDLALESMDSREEEVEGQDMTVDEMFDSVSWMTDEEVVIESVIKIDSLPEGDLRDVVQDVCEGIPKRLTRARRFLLNVLLVLY